MQIPKVFIDAKAQVTELVDGKIQVTSKGGSSIIVSSQNELNKLGEQFNSLLLDPGNKTQSLARATRLFASPAATLLDGAAKVGATLVSMSQKYGLAFTADIAGSYLKSSIEACISEAKKGVLG